MLRKKTASTTSTRATRVTTTVRTTRKTTMMTTTRPIKTQAKTLSSTVNKQPIMMFSTSTTEKTSTTSWKPNLFETIRPRLTLPADWGRRTETTTEELDFVLMTTMSPETQLTTKLTTKKQKKIKQEVMSSAMIVQPFLLIFIFLF